MATRANPPGWDSRLAEARRQAKERLAEVDRPGPEWPRPEDVDLDAALAELTVAIYVEGYKIGLGCMTDASGVWCRLSCPSDSPDWRAGKTAFTVSDTVDKALRKAVQLLESQSDKVWKPDQFARPREKPEK